MSTPLYRTEADRSRARAEWLQEEFDGLSPDLQAYIVDALHEAAIAEDRGLIQHPITGSYE